RGDHASPVSRRVFQHPESSEFRQSLRWTKRIWPERSLSAAFRLRLRNSRRGGRQSRGGIGRTTLNPAWSEVHFLSPVAILLPGPDSIRPAFSITHQENSRNGLPW